MIDGRDNPSRLRLQTEPLSLRTVRQYHGYKDSPKRGVAKVKKLAKRVLGNLATKLPWGAREAILDRLGGDLQYLDLIAGSARRAGITGFLASGEYGTIQSAVGDSAIFGTYARTGKWASSTNDLMVKFFAKRGGTYLDIGANIGLTAIPIAQNPNVRVVAFEPDPTNFLNLKDNVLRNCRYNNVILHDVALYRERARMTLELSHGNLGDHRLRVESRGAGVFGEEKRTTVVVQAIPLDEIVNDIQFPLAVKIDTQGAEPHVIEGGVRTLSRAEMIVLEWSPYHLRRLGGDPNVVIEFARTHFSFGATSEGEGCFGDVTDISKVVEAMKALLEESEADAYYHRYADIMLSKSQD